jgi:hypothetical protein
MIERVSGMPALQFREESGSELVQGAKRFLCFVLIV